MYIVHIPNISTQWVTCCTQYVAAISLYFVHRQNISTLWVTCYTPCLAPISLCIVHRHIHTIGDMLHTILGSQISVYCLQTRYIHKGEMLHTMLVGHIHRTNIYIQYVTCCIPSLQPYPCILFTNQTYIHTIDDIQRKANSGWHCIVII